jgi:hypothetical protein
MHASRFLLERRYLKAFGTVRGERTPQILRLPVWIIVDNASTRNGERMLVATRSDAPSWRSSFESYFVCTTSRYNELTSERGSKGHAHDPVFFSLLVYIVVR